MKFHRLQMSRPFDIWKHSTNDGKGNLTKIVFEYDLPSNDCIFSDVKHIFVTRSLADVLSKEGFTGYSLSPVITTYSDSYPNLQKQDPVWLLEVSGAHGVDDFGMLTPTILIVSEKVLSVIKLHGSDDVKVFDYDPNYRHPVPDWLLNDDDAEE